MGSLTEAVLSRKEARLTARVWLGMTVAVWCLWLGVVEAASGSPLRHHDLRGRADPFVLHPGTLAEALREGRGSQAALPALLDDKLDWVVEGKRDVACRKGIQCLLAGRLKEALALLEQAQRANSNNALAMAYYAVALDLDAVFGNRDPARNDRCRLNLTEARKAGSYYENVIRLHPDNAILYRNCGLLYDRLHQKECSRAYFVKAIQIDPKDPRCREAFARCLASWQYFKEAVTQITAAIDTCPDSVLLYIVRAQYSKSMGKFKDSESDSNHVLKLKPDSVDAWFERGNARLCSGQLKLSLGDFNQAIKLQPKAATLYESRALNYDLLGDFSHALKDSERGVALDPGNVWARINYCSALTEVHRYAEALRQADIAVRLMPDSGAAHGHRAADLCNLGRLDEALWKPTRPIRLNPDDDAALRLRADLCLKKGDGEQAMVDYDEVRRLVARHQALGDHPFAFRGTSATFL